MTGNQLQQQYAIGMVGLGVMGHNVVLHMADHGFTVAGYDRDQAQVEASKIQICVPTFHTSWTTS